MYISQIKSNLIPKCFYIQDTIYIFIIFLVICYMITIKQYK